MIDNVEIFILVYYSNPEQGNLKNLNQKNRQLFIYTW